MIKAVLHIATSVDGFIANKEGSSEFALAAQKADKNFKKFYDSVGSVVMGRKTYDYLKVKTPELFKEKEVYVITHYLRQKEDNITFVHENIKGCLQNLKETKEKDIWILGGAEIINILIKENMIDEMVLTTVPVILGTGTRLFKDDNPQKLLTVKECLNFDGFVQTHYTA
ncbi:MAG: dihydrofolate reductase [Alphaproteobacteria bacterium]|nr:dihydrofolate reductase [Alphaproteobacteria bacterium]